MIVNSINWEGRVKFADDKQYVLVMNKNKIRMTIVVKGLITNQAMCYMVSFGINVIFHINDDFIGHVRSDVIFNIVRDDTILKLYKS